MKSLQDIITEKLRIGKSIKVDDIPRKTADDLNIDIAYPFRSCLDCLRFDERKSMATKMEEARDKKRNPKTLVNSRSYTYHYVNKWFCAVMLQWDEAMDWFREQLDKPKYITGLKTHDVPLLLDAYIYQIYKKTTRNSWSGWYSTRTIENACEHYFDKYNIDYK